ncbi:MAG: RNA methyltransferase [Vicinamibacterales bacterium]
MPIERLTTPFDPRVADYRHIAEADLVKSRGLFVAEGRLVVKRLIEDGHRFRSVLVNDTAYRSLEAALIELAQHVPVYICETTDLVEITGYDIHRGCLALVERPTARTSGSLLAEVTQTRKSRTIIVILEGVANADNVGGVFRNAAAFSSDAVLLSPTCCDPLYRKAIRTSMASTLRVPFARIEKWPDDLAQLRDHGFTIAALTPREPSVTLSEFSTAPPSARLALLVGTEGPGLTTEAEAAADVRVRIPIAPEVDSLNVAVAVGIALHRLCDAFSVAKLASGDRSSS